MIPGLPGIIDCMNQCCGSGIRIDLAVLNPDPDSGAWKLNKINKQPCFIAFQKGFCIFICMFLTYYLLP
jgi:hypothetical protein